MSQGRLIPRDVTAMVVMEYGPDSRDYLLWRNSHTILIQSKADSEWNSVPGRENFSKQEKKTNYILEVIQTVLDTAKIGTSNWGHLVQSKGDYHIVYQNRHLRPISCRTWAPLVDESELNITKWETFPLQMAMWKGREVRLIMARDEASRDLVEAETQSRELLQGLDVSFDALAHVVRDGEVVGLMLEAEYGRGLELRDRAIIYDAVTRMQNRGLAFRHWTKYDISNIAIADGKVRFVNTANIMHLDTKDVEAMKTALHWKCLERLFYNLQTEVQNRRWRSDRNFAQECVFLPNRVSPERCLLDTPNVWMKLRDFYIHHFDDPAYYEFIGILTNKKKSVKRHSVRRLLAPEVEGEQQSSLEELPLGLALLSQSVRHHKHPPYSRPSTRKALLLAKDDIDLRRRGESTRRQST